MTLSLAHIKPAHYFPLAGGRYLVKPGLFRLGEPFGNGAHDSQIFQFDATFPEYRDQKMRSRRECLAKYYLTHSLGAGVAMCVTQFVVHSLAHEHPDLFSVDRRAGRTVLDCRPSGERLCFDPDWNLDLGASCTSASPTYIDAIDALAAQVQEDLVVTQCDGDSNWAAALHVCFPNAWAPADKIGLDFAHIHEPVPHAESMNREGNRLASIMCNATKGLVRFVWGVTVDTRLNHHPKAPEGTTEQQWARQSFDPGNPHAFVRIERQTIWGFPEKTASLFIIRTYLTDCHEIKKDRLMCDSLCSAIESMSQASLVYKGLDQDRNALLCWLRDEV